MKSCTVRCIALLGSLIGVSPATAACPAFTDMAHTALDPPAAATFQRNWPNSRQWIYQEFAKQTFDHETSVSAWTIHVTQRSFNNSHANLLPAIETAIYTTSEGKRIKVLKSLWPQQIIVPYAQSTDVVYDLWENPPLISLTEKEASLAPCGQVGPAVYPRNWTSAWYDLAPVNSPRSIYVKEIRDTGIATASYHGYDDEGDPRPPEMRRGQELVIWGVVDVDNYDNIIEYHFRDDGEVSAFVGPTGWNTSLGGPARVQSGNTPHAHTVLWRFEPGLAAPGKAASVSVAEYNQRSEHTHEPTEHVTETLLTKEEALAFQPSKFTTLRITSPDSFNDARPGKPPQPNSYVLSLVTDGAPRHRMWPGDDEIRKRFDFAVLRAGPDEITSQPFPNLRFKYLDDLIDGEPLAGRGVAIFAYSTIAHLPRAEDFVVHPGDPDYEEDASWNVTAVRWSGIRLTPRNVYTDVPFSYPTPDARLVSAGMPLFGSCAPLAAPPTIEMTTCNGRRGLPEYAIGLSPINRNPFGKEATKITIFGDTLLGFAQHIEAPIPFGATHEISLPERRLMVRPPSNQSRVCLQIAMAGQGWNCPRENVCVRIPKDACGGD